MKSNISCAILILLTVFLICSCNMEPELTAEADRIATVGINSVSDIINKYDKSGHYDGLSVVLGDNDLVVYNFSNCSTTIDLSNLYPSWGTKTVVISGQVSLKFDAYPESYPATMTLNIRYLYGGETHTLEMKVRVTGISSMTASAIKVDGVSYKPKQI